MVISYISFKHLNTGQKALKEYLVQVMLLKLGVRKKTSRTQFHAQSNHKNNTRSTNDIVNNTQYP